VVGSIRYQVRLAEQRAILAHGLPELSGNGQKELLPRSRVKNRRGKGGHHPFGRDITHDSPASAARLRALLVPEERLGRAAVPTLRSPRTAAHAAEGVARGGLLRPGNLRQLALRLIERFG